MTDTKAAWDEAGAKFSALGLKLKLHAEQARGEVESEQVKNALHKLAEAIDEVFTTMSEVVKDPAVKADVRDVGRTLTDAMSATFAETSEELRKAFTFKKK